MSSFDSILHKIEVLMFYNMVADDHIIEDEGQFNIPMENNNNVRYTFIDDKECGERNIIEQKKIIFLNDIMEILSDLHSYIHENEPQCTPIYFNKNALKAKIESEISVNLEEEIDGESGEEDEEISEQPQQPQQQQQPQSDQSIEQLTNEVTDMEL